jgi:GMP synthase-like glutamine amidotransferase
MRIHCLQHVPFEGLGSMGPYFQKKGHPVSHTHLYLGQPCPSPSDFDWLVVMGGPMGVHDDAKYPWLPAEKRFIAESIDQGRHVLGICLGAQLIADVLGARVVKNRHREIGWFPIHPAKEIASTLLGPVFPAPLEVFHWHGDTFEIPSAGVPFASSEACQNQGFMVGDRVVGLQFHLETTPESARALVENCGDELDGSAYVQSGEEILAAPAKFAAINGVMTALLEALTSAP